MWHGDVYGTAMAGVLLLIGGMLYLDLEDPDTMQQIRRKTNSWVSQFISPSNDTLTQHPNTEANDDGLHL